MSPGGETSSVVLRQRIGIFGGYAKYSLTDEGVQIVRRRLGSREDSFVPYGVMWPKFMWHRDIPVGWIVGSILVLGGAAVGWVWIIAKAITDPHSEVGVLAGLCVLFTLFGLPILYGVFANWRDLALVVNRYGGGYVLVLYGRRPGRTAVRDFLEELEQRIRDAAPLEPERKEGLVQELRRLAELHKEGALTDEEFTQAKKQLLGFERPPIGL